MQIGIPRESLDGETRVSSTPDTVKKLIDRGLEVVVERGAGQRANALDSMYEEAGAKLVDGDTAWGADVVLKVNAPTDAECDRLREGAVLVSFFWPAQNPELLKRLAARKITLFAMDQVPRISRAQKMDALSSMANIAGYRAVVEAAQQFGSFFSGQITAAGRTPPARVLVIGAGVAGLAAIAAAKGLGAVVHAFDTREATRDQVKSLGGEFIDLDFEESGEGSGGYAKEMSQAFIDAEMALFREYAKKTDIIITTALIPGKPAPKLILEDMVESMKPGSVVVDLAAEQGGNCECTVPGEIARKHDVTLIGLTNLPARLPTLASQLYGTNVFNLLIDLLDDQNAFVFDLEEPVTRGSIVLKDGEVLWPPPKITDPSPPPKPTPPPEKKKPADAKAEDAKKPAAAGLPWPMIGIGAVTALLVVIGIYADREFLQHFTVFILACVVGWHVVWNVTAALHTPLMSVTNAISGIILIGGMGLLRGSEVTAATVLGLLAVLVAAVNVAGGFLVTHRMLKMFRK